METKTKNAKVNEVKETTSKVDLMSKLNQMNLSANVSHAIKNKYNYPEHLQNEKSTDKQKKSYRRKIQKTILVYLSVDSPTKEQKESFNEFCKTFISNFQSIEKSEVNDLYSFHNEKEKETANKILNLYKAIK